MIKNLNTTLPTYVSLGEYCETAYQINRHLSGNSSYFFDWLITHDDKYKSIFLSNDEFFKSKNWKITPELNRLIDLGTGLIFQHEFALLEGSAGIIDVSQVEQHLPVAFSKFIHLKNKTLKAIESGENVYLIRKEKSADFRCAKLIMEELQSSFMFLNKNLKIIVTSNNLEKEIISGKYLIIKTDASDSWSGDDLSWNRLFNISMMN